jgi:hypothetical protein
MSSFAPQIGTRVWHLTLGASGRVTAHAQGGLTCSVQLEWSKDTIRCIRGDLLPLAEHGAD